MDGGLKFDYYYGAEAEQFSFYRVPRLLIKDRRFKGLSSDAKLLYGLMLDRMALSMKNGWFDDENRAYIHYTVENIMEDLGCARATCAKVLAELDSKKGIGLIEKKRQGLGKPDIIYVKNFVLSEPPAGGEGTAGEPAGTDVSTEVQKLNFKKYKNQDSRSSEIELLEVQKADFKSFKKQTSGSSEIEPLEVQKSNPNYNNTNYTDLSYTNPINQSDRGIEKQEPGKPDNGMIDVMDDAHAYMEIIKGNIEYEHHMKYGDWSDRGLYEELYEVICEIVCVNEDGFKIGGVKVDINPITEGKTGTLGEYLPGVEAYLEEKRAAILEKAAEQAQMEKRTVVTLTVAECGEFHNFGEYHENIAGVEEAIAIFNRIPPNRMNGIPSIGINIHTEGTESYEDTQMDIVSGRVADLEILDYVPEITDNPKAVEVIAELIDKLPDIEVRGSLEKWQAAFLAAEIDQLSYDYDTIQYNHTVEDREAQIANITEDIRSGNTGYLNDFLNALISDSIREGMTDIFGKGTELDDSEGVQTARKAKELLDKLAEYKPLAKIEELEECNYNMIDNVLNNEKPKEEKQTGRISIKEKLAEKKAVIEQRDKAEKEIPEKGTEKKSEREI